MKTPITVAALIERLQKYAEINPDLPVLVDCEDDYYSGAISTDDIRSGSAILVSVTYREAGEKVERRHWRPGERGDYPDIVETRPCLIIRVE